MFPDAVSSTPMVTDAADAYFQTVRGDHFRSDVSFLSTLRALAAPRMPEGDRLHLLFGSSDYRSNTISQVPVSEAVSAICHRYPFSTQTGLICIHSFDANQEHNYANFRAVETGLGKKYPGFTRLDKITAFYQKSFRVDCYIHPERKNVLLFVDQLDYKKLHYLQVSILAFLPWYFDQEAGVSDLELELLQSLQEPTSYQYQDCLSRMAEGYDFRSSTIRRLLSGFETAYERQERERVQQFIAEMDDTIKQYNERIGKLLHERQEACIRLLGLEARLSTNTGDSELMQYFLSNKQLYLEQVHGTEIQFCVKGYLTYFDREMAADVLNNPNSFAYPYGKECHDGISKGDMKRLLWEIFVSEKPRLKIKFCAAYEFCMDRNVTVLEDYFFSNEFSDCMPNPHLQFHGCLGGHRQVINMCLQQRDYIGALEQCIASCKNLAWGDYTVMKKFIYAMWGDADYGNNRCIELPDGRVAAPAEAIAWLNQQESQTKGDVYIE